MARAGAIRRSSRPNVRAAAGVSLRKPRRHDRGIDLGPALRVFVASRVEKSISSVQLQKRGFLRETPTPARQARHRFPDPPETLLAAIQTSEHPGSDRFAALAMTGRGAPRCQIGLAGLSSKSSN